MAEYHEQIAEASKEVKKLKSEKFSPEKLKQYAQDIGQTADAGVSDLKSTKVDSPAARNFLDSSAPKVTGFLKDIATKGYEIVTQKKENKDIGDETYQSIEGLHGSLKTQLNIQKESIGFFALIEEADKGYDKVIEKLTTATAANSISTLQELQKKLPPPAGPSKEYRDAVDKKLGDKIKELIDFLPAKAKVDGFNADVSNVDKLATAYEKEPTTENLAAVQDALAKIDATKFGNDVFGSLGKGGAQDSPLLQALWDEDYRHSLSKLEGIPSRLKAKEKVGTDAEAQLTLDVTEKAYREVIGPDQQAYFYGKMTPEEKNSGLLVTRLLSNVIQTKAMISKYIGMSPGDTINGDIHKKLTNLFGTLDDTQKAIEKTKLEYRNVTEAGSKGIGKYITFPENPTEKEIYHYGFTMEYYSLSKEDQVLIKAQADEICKKNQESVKKETADEVLKFAKPEEKIKILKERMGEKGGNYFSGLEKLQANDLDGAVTDFQSYIALSKTFDNDEKQLHADTIRDAQEKIHQIFSQKLDLVDSLFKDVKDLKWARQKMVGNAELNPTDGAVVDAFTNDLANFRKEVNDGKVTNFEERYNALKAKAQKASEQWKKDWGDSDVLSHLDELRSLAAEKDPEKRKAGFVKFATEARELHGYKLAQKYLDYALEDDYKSAAKTLSKDSVLKKMLSEKDFLANLDKQAEQQYDTMIKENPGMKGLSLALVRQKLLDRALGERYKLELRRDLTGEFSHDPTIKLYNNWFPLDKPDWYKPWDYGAEQWDDFKWDVLSFVATTIPTLGIGAGAATAGRLGASVVSRLALRFGLAEAEIALVEAGGIAGLRAAVSSGRTLTFGATRLLTTIAIEGGVMYGGGLVMEYLETGEVQDFSSPGQMAKNFAKSLATVSAFKVVGVLQKLGPVGKAIEKAMEKGGASKILTWLGTETFSGAAGMGMEALFSEKAFTGKDAFLSMLDNYVTSIGMGAVHGKGDIDSKGTKKIKEAYTQEKLDTAAKGFGADFSNPDSIKSARVDDLGNLIINGKIVKGFDESAIGHLPENVQSKILSLAPNSALDTHFRSNFSTDVPKELWPDPQNPESAKQIQGWIDKEGKVHFNLNHLNEGFAVSGDAEKGPYRELPKKKIMPEGYSAKTNEKGDLVVVNAQGETISYKDFIKSPEGQPLRQELKRIKDHEVSHRILEAVNNITDGRLSADLADFFTKRPELLPEGNKEMKFRDLQELACHVVDGSLKLSDTDKLALQSAIQKSLPDFDMGNVRNLDAKMVSRLNSETFKRTHADALDIVGFKGDKVDIPGKPYDGMNFFSFDSETGTVTLAKETSTGIGIEFDEVPISEFSKIREKADTRILKKGDMITTIASDGSLREGWYILGTNTQTGEITIGRKRIVMDPGGKMHEVTDTKIYNSLEVLQSESRDAIAALPFKNAPFGLSSPQQKSGEISKDWSLSTVDPENGKVTVKNTKTGEVQSFQSMDHFLLAAKNADIRYQRQEELRRLIPMPSVVLPPAKFRNLGLTGLAPPDLMNELGRPKITSGSTKVDGGVFLPKALEKRMEAIVVDTEKDPVVKQYIENFKNNVLAWEKAGYKIKPEDMMQIIAAQVQKDFPYSYRMIDDNYSLKTYEPGKKYQLGIFMNNQDMICRHMGLLSEVMIEKMKSDPAFKKYFPEGMVSNFMSDNQTNEQKGKGDGHAYTIVSMPTPEGMKYFSIDPANGSQPFMDLGKSISDPSMDSMKSRYLFSLFRTVFDRAGDNRDTALLDQVFKNEKANPELLHILKDALKASNSPTARIELNKYRKTLGLPDL